MLRLSAILFLVISFQAVAQQSIKGRVINEANGAPVPGSSVFITSTSKGTLSDAGGYFVLNDVPSGKHELVISSVGYETVVYPFSDAQLPLQLRVELKIKVQELQNVTVEPYVEEGWDKWGKTFTENFIGYTDNAARCRIKNQQAIRFRYFKKSNRLIAFADEPLQIENRALGYHITYQLEDFEINFRERTSVYVGYSLYSEYGRDRRAWQRRREQAYYGSMMHFVRSLYAGSLLQNGFEVRRMQRIANMEKERVRALYKVVRTTSFQGGVATITEKEPPGLHPDTIAYYKSVLRQQDYTDITGKDLLTADSLILQREGDHLLFYFPDYLAITYKNELEDESYLRSQMQNRKPYYQRSWIYLPDLKPLWIERNGSYYNPRDLYFMGYWSWSEKMGDSLPLDYIPGEQG